MRESAAAFDIQAFTRWEYEIFFEALFRQLHLPEEYADPSFSDSEEESDDEEDSQEETM